MRIWTAYLKMKFHWNIMKAHNIDILSSVLILKAFEALDQHLYWLIWFPDFTEAAQVFNISFVICQWAETKIIYR